MGIPVDAKTVDKVEIYKWRPPIQRFDIWPFLIFYLSWAILALPKLSSLDSSVILGVIFALHILTVLFTAWSIDFRCFAHAQKVSKIEDAEFCKVFPEKFVGNKEIAPLVRRKKLPAEAQLLGEKDPKPANRKPKESVRAETETETEIRFQFHKQHFIFSTEDNNNFIFRKLKFPSKEKFKTYANCTGYGTDLKVEAGLDKWGKNIFDFPQPNFWELYKQQCLEPFFVFQVFCVALWCLDSYWYYSLFTLFMLLLFESTVVSSRLRTLKELRQVKVDNQEIKAYRNGKWVSVTGVDLLPGDLVSIGRLTNSKSEEKTVPADLLLLSGTAIANEALLTGESTPQWKGPVSGKELEERLSVRKEKAHILFGGTKIIQHTPDKNFLLKSPDNGCIAVVLRTGFDTSQGKLMRTILFSTERVSANSWESGLFILFLVFFALIASGYVLLKGLEDPNRSRYKLILNCTLIITSVIPPELPMELSIAVNTSLIALMKKGIYCTEPFRIPFGGKVDTCCFDKTGTLTSDDMEFRGVVEFNEKEEENLLINSSFYNQFCTFCLATCHSLVFVENKLVGDPLEKAALKGVDWNFVSDDKAVSKKTPNKSIQILSRFHFASHLKRMAVIVKVEESNAYYAFVKGAPETIFERLKDKPSGYTEAYKHYTRQGSRVLALAYKPIPDLPINEIRNLERDEVECSLIFAGFAVFACPLRNDSASILLELKRSSHDLVMITGDQALTACHVANQVHILSRPVLILTRISKDVDTFDWLSPDETNRIPFSEKEIDDICFDYDLCISGDGLEMLAAKNLFTKIVPLVQVFARVAPEQKEAILKSLKSIGKYTLMCGDGTNDVGALKQAHVGIALLNSLPSNTNSNSNQTNQTNQILNSNSPSSASTPESKKTGIRSRKPSQLSSITDSNSNSSPSSLSHLTPRERHALRIKEQQERLKKLLEEEGDGKPPLVKLGDASMASPFTAKHSSVSPVKEVISQGRSTLVTTLQMFKILGLNCLASAYVLSVMYLDGVKLGDTQATISGIFTAMFFLFISHAKPLPVLSNERPHPDIFSAYVIASLLGQFAIHLTFLATVVRGAQSYMPQECIEPDFKFHPNLVNTVSYMASMMIQVATFAVNYIGHPFNQSIKENKPFFYALSTAAIFFTALTSDVFREMNDSLELVKLPQPFGIMVLLMAALMFVACYSWECFLRWLFPVRVRSLRKQRVLSLDEKKQQ